MSSQRSARPRGEGEPLPRARPSGARAHPRAAARRRAVGRRAAGGARARLGRHVAAPGGACAGSVSSSRGVRGRASTTASTTSGSSTCSRPAAAIITRQLAEQQSILQRARELVIGALLVAGAGRGRARGGCWRSRRRTFAGGLVVAGGGSGGRGGRRASGRSRPATRSARRSRARSIRASASTA